MGYCNFSGQIHQRSAWRHESRPGGVNDGNGLGERAVLTMATAEENERAPVSAPPRTPTPSPNELAKGYLKTVFGALGLNPDLRRRAILAWCDRNGLPRSAGSGGTEAAGGAAGGTAAGNQTAAAAAVAAAAGDELAKAVVAKVAAKLRLPLKLSRFRLVARVLVILAISYVDLFTDGLMLSEYLRTGERGAFAASAACLGCSWLIHVWLAYYLNAGRGAGVVVREMLLAAVYLAPVVGTYRFIVGTEDEDEDEEEHGAGAKIDPVVVYSGVKSIEVRFVPFTN